MRPAAILVTWTVLIWVGRIRNGGSFLLAASFLVLAAFVLVSLRRRRWRPVAVTALVVWTIAVWAVRTPMILARDHSGGFKVVHTLLAVVSVGLALWAERDVHRQRRAAATRTAIR